MRILLHSCCGPCSIYPLKQLRQLGVDVTAYFYNPNIHPFKEFKRRLTTFTEFTNSEKLPSIVDPVYGLTEFIRKVAFNEQKRCTLCYHMRLVKTAQFAKQQGYDGFTTTLLYSRYQNHDHILATGRTLASKFGVEFHYEDYRLGWQYGIDLSIEKEMYRQPYCGCIYSEQERYDKSLRKKKKS